MWLLLLPLLSCCWCWECCCALDRGWCCTDEGKTRPLVHSASYRERPLLPRAEGAFVVVVDAIKLSTASTPPPTRLWCSWCPTDEAVFRGSPPETASESTGANMEDVIQCPSVVVMLFAYFARTHTLFSFARKSTHTLVQKRVSERESLSAFFILFCSAKLFLECERENHAQAK